MAQINFARLILGGIVAGLIIIAGELVLNGLVLADQWDTLRQQHSIEAPNAARFTVGAVLTLSYGLILMWIYVAIRPRFGAGPSTAIIAGLTFWAIAYVLFLLSVWANGFVTLYVAGVSIAWGLVEAPLAALGGAALYREARPA